MPEDDAQRLRNQLLETFNHPDIKPLNKSELARLLGIKPENRRFLKQQLDFLEHENRIFLGKGNRYRLFKDSPKAPSDEKKPRRNSDKNRDRKRDAKNTPKSHNELYGTIRMQPQGFGWFYADKSHPHNQAQDFIDLNVTDRFKIQDRHLNVALNGDTVKVAVNLEQKMPKWMKHSKRHKERFQNKKTDITAKILQIVERSKKGIVGTYFKKRKFHYVQPDDSGMPAVIDLTSTPEGLNHRDKVVINVTEWNDPFTTPRGEIIEILGDAETPGIEIQAIIHKHGLSETFPDNVLEQTKLFKDEISSEEWERREDWRNRLVMTIDPYDAKDHDDAIWVSKLDNGGWELAVHIADVSYFVKPQSPLDLEAVERGNSTYLVDRVLPMLPQRLSNDLCSLKLGVDRLTKCATIRFDLDGNVIKSSFSDAIIHSQAKLSYEHAQQILDGKPLETIKELKERVLDSQDLNILKTQIQTSWELASVLRKKRFANGALDMEMPEVKIRLDEEFRPVSIDKQQHSASNQLIEEFMLIANEQVAKKLREAEKPNIYRVHDEPDSGKLNEFAENAKLYGYHPGDLTNRHHIQKLLDDSKGSPEEFAIKLGLLKSLRRAEYHQDPLGHYGLAKGDYCHFTSPIRRYSDLVTHRALQSFLSNRPKKTDALPSIIDIESIAADISKTERNSADAETESKLLKKLEFLFLGQLKEEPDVFKAVVTDVKANGLFVEIPNIVMKGMIRKEDFPKRRGDRWSFEPNSLRFTRGDNKVLQLGDSFEVLTAKVDFERKLVDFVISTET